MIVLLTMFTANASSSETPAPSQPATLLAMMLLVTLTEFQAHKARDEHAMRPFGKLIASLPLMCCNRRPPPLPLSAELPMIRLALMTRPRPVPSLGPIEPGAETQSWSLVEHGGWGSGRPIPR